MRAHDETRRRLLLESLGGRKPTVERMACMACQGVADHAKTVTSGTVMAQTGGDRARAQANRAFSTVISARHCAARVRAVSIVTGRVCVRLGMRARAAATAARSISAITNPGSDPPSASTRPQGSTTMEWP